MTVDREALKAANPSLAGLIDLLADVADEHTHQLEALDGAIQDNTNRLATVEADVAAVATPAPAATPVAEGKTQ